MLPPSSTVPGSGDCHSDLELTQRAQYLGVLMDTTCEKVHPIDSRISGFQNSHKVLSQTDPLAMLWQQLGHMASLEQFINLKRLRMRPLQWHLNSGYVHSICENIMFEIYFWVCKAPPNSFHLHFLSNGSSERNWYSLFLFVCPEFTTILWPYFF